jgi:hypothetical protein
MPSARAGVRLAAAAILAASAVVPVRAGARSGGGYEVPLDAAGVSGGSGGKSASGWSVAYTLGAATAGGGLSSPSGRQVRPGLWGGTAYRSAAEGGTILFGDPDRPGRLEIPPNALPSDFLVFVSADPLERPLAVSPAAIRRANEGLARSLAPTARPLDGRLWEILAVDGTGRPVQGLFREPARLTLPYRDDDRDGLVDGASPPLRAADLSVWWLDEAHSLWVRLPDSRPDEGARSVTVPVRHFSVYTVMGAPGLASGDAHAFPVPWRPDGPASGIGPGRTGTQADGITFTNLPGLARVRVYTLSGRLVREIDHADGTPQHAWDVRDDRGDDVASGTYLYVIEAAGARKSGKLVVIR